MGFAVTMIFYHLIGSGVAVAVFLADRGRSPWRRAFRVLTAAAFWPLYLPILLARPVAAPGPEEAPTGPDRNRDRDEMAEAIARVESELDGALSSLDGWAEGVLSREADRIGELRALWAAQADRIREMDRLLARSAGAASGPDAAGERCRQSEQARRANLERLRQVRRRSFEDLMGTLAWVRELVSMIHLAKFTGAPAARAEELIAQVAAAVEGVSAVTWQEPAAAPSLPLPLPLPCEEARPCDSFGASATSSPRT